MSIGSYIIFLLLVLSGIIILAVSLRSEKPLRCLLLSFFSGVGSLFAVNIVSAVTGVAISVNPATLSVSALGGVPGTVFLLLCDVLVS